MHASSTLPLFRKNEYYNNDLGPFDLIMQSFERYMGMNAIFWSVTIFSLTFVYAMIIPILMPRLLNWFSQCFNSEQMKRVYIIQRKNTKLEEYLTTNQITFTERELSIFDSIAMHEEYNTYLSNLANKSAFYDLLVNILSTIEYDMQNKKSSTIYVSKMIRYLRQNKSNYVNVLSSGVSITQKELSTLILFAINSYIAENYTISHKKAKDDTITEVCNCIRDIIKFLAHNYTSLSGKLDYFEAHTNNLFQYLSNNPFKSENNNSELSEDQLDPFEDREDRVESSKTLHFPTLKRKVRFVEEHKSEQKTELRESPDTEHNTETIQKGFE